MGSFSVVAAVLIFLAAGSSALADGYGIDDAVKTSAGSDTGTVECSFDERCAVTFDSLKLKLDVSVSHNDPARARLNLSGDTLDCCFFENAVSKFTVDARLSLIRQRLFKGQRARGLLYLQNEYVGDLYLRFHFRGNHLDDDRINKYGNY